MLKKIKKSAAEKVDGAKPQCFVLFILSHGSRGNNEQVVFGTDGKYLTKTKIVHALDDCSNLRGVPHLVFLQCCRGSTKEVFVFVISYVMRVCVE